MDTARERRIRFRHPLPRRAPVDRHRLLADLARDRRVIHVGFVDELQGSKHAAGVWLHERLAAAAQSLVGLDVSTEGVAWARERGYEAYCVDAQSVEAIKALQLRPADLVIAGEIVEHLDAPGPFLRAMRELVRDDGVLVVTTPNAYRLLNLVVPLLGLELVHPDHTAWHSPRTLRTLLERNGWRVERIAYYRSPLRRGGGSARVGNVGRVLLAALSHLVPTWSEGIAACARRDERTPQAGGRVPARPGQRGPR